MKYYRVKPEYDQEPIWNGKGRQIGFLIANELYTPNEYGKLNVLRKEQKLEPIFVSQKDTYKSFGARFEC